jgi:hypothetical protein
VQKNTEQLPGKQSQVGLSQEKFRLGPVTRSLGKVQMLCMVCTASSLSGLPPVTLDIQVLGKKNSRTCQGPKYAEGKQVSTQDNWQDEG